MKNNIEKTAAVIDYIEEHLSEKLDLELVAEAVHYSKYYLHRIFTQTVGLTVHDYVKRRQLTEAAKLLVFSEKSILEIALLAGYESQQAFTDSFRAMYKKAPGQYREEEEFYPLQLRYCLNSEPAEFGGIEEMEQRIRPASEEDIPAWIELARLAVDGFPCLDEAQHLQWLRECIRQGQAFILNDRETTAGVMGITKNTGSIDFLGVHPQYRKKGIAQAFLRKAFSLLEEGHELTVTTFREGDRADTGHRADLKRLGFAEAELLVEFGYPTQRFVLQKEKLEGMNDES